MIGISIAKVPKNFSPPFGPRYGYPHCNGPTITDGRLVSGQTRLVGPLARFLVGEKHTRSKKGQKAEKTKHNTRRSYIAHHTPLVKPRHYTPSCAMKRRKCFRIVEHASAHCGSDCFRPECKENMLSALSLATKASLHRTSRASCLAFHSRT
jgi:hypothetical protein